VSLSLFLSSDLYKNTTNKTFTARPQGISSSAPQPQRSGGRREHVESPTKRVKREPVVKREPGEQEPAFVPNEFDDWCKREENSEENLIARYGRARGF